MARLKLDELAGGAAQEKFDRSFSKVAQNLMDVNCPFDKKRAITMQFEFAFKDASKTETIVPSPVHLKPYRTFDEIDQPESDFIFRVQSNKFDGITCALFSADGGAWKTEAKQRIKEYLSNELSDLIKDGRIIILA